MDRLLTSRILTACVTEHDWDHPPPGLADLVAGRDLTGLADAAAYHGVVVAVHHSLKGVPQVPSAVQAILNQSHALERRSHQATLADLAVARRALDPLDAPWVLLKGPALAYRVYARPELRACGDLDLLVPRPAFPEALGALERAGGRVLETDWLRLRHERRSQVHLLLPGGTIADLHWHVMTRAAVRDVFAVSVEEMIARARPAAIAGAEIRILNPSDTLAHLALHACRHGGDRLRWLKDVERVIAMERFSWTDVLGAGAQWGIGPLLWLILRRARGSLGAKVPDTVLHRLAPPWPLRAALAAADGVFPPERSAFRRTPARTLAVVLRRDLVTTLRAAGRGLRRAQTPGRAGQWPNRPPGRTGSDLDSAERAAYLEAVAAGGDGEI